MPPTALGERPEVDDCCGEAVEAVGDIRAVGVAVAGYDVVLFTEVGPVGGQYASSWLGSGAEKPTVVGL
jgi:hypothetical protein